MEEKHLSDSPIAYHILKCDSEKWIMLLHAAFVDHNMFARLFEHFRDRYNIIAVDILGHGGSTRGRRGDSIDKMSGWMKDILLEEKVEKVHLLGVSLGAVIVQDFANHYPEMVASLASFGGYDINNFDPKLQKGNSSAQMGMMMKAFISVKWFAEANKKISAYTEQGQNVFYQMNLCFSKKSFMYLASLGTMVNRHKTGKRDYPLLVGCGEHDIPSELELVKAWAASEENCQTVILENAGHCANLDAPAAFNQVMEEFWK